MDQLNRAIQLRESGNYEEARSLLLGLLDQYPLNSAIWYQCAWIHDVMGLESEAVPYYKQALELGLSGEEKQGAILGLGSTYRTLSLYKEAQSVFEEAIQEFPERSEFRVFYAMVLYNRQAYSEHCHHELNRKYSIDVMIEFQPCIQESLSTVDIDRPACENCPSVTP